MNEKFQLNKQQLDDLKKMIKIILRINGIEEKYYLADKKKYNAQIEILFGKAFGTLNNTLFGSPPNELSYEAYENFKMNTAKIVEKFKSPYNDIETEIFIKLFNPFVNSIENNDRTFSTTPDQQKGLSLFTETCWSCFELDNGDVSEQFLGFGSIEFKGTCYSQYIYYKDLKITVFTGGAIYIPFDDMLVSQMADKSTEGGLNSGFTIFLIKANAHLDNVELCVGHKSFMHPIQKKIITKNFLILKRDSYDDFVKRSRNIQTHTLMRKFLLLNPYQINTETESWFDLPSLTRFVEKT